jgi:hypothetical protein
MTDTPLDDAARALDPAPFRQMAREYYDTMRASYEKDKRTRSAQSFGFFGFAGFIVFRFLRHRESVFTMETGQILMIVAVFGALGAMAAGLNHLCFKIPRLRTTLLAAGGVILLAAAATYWGLSGMYPDAWTDRLNLPGEGEGYYFLGGAGLSMLGLVFIVPAAASILREAPVPTDELVEARALMLAAQARKADEVRLARETGVAPGSAYSRRRRR